MTRVFALLCLAAPAWSCSTKTEIKPDPQTKADLDACRGAAKAKAEHIALLEKENADLKLHQGDGVVVTIEGDVLTIKAGKGPHVAANPDDPKGNAADAQLYDAFVKAVKRSRPAVQKCYQSALKKNTALQARTVQLTIRVDYKTSGVVSGATFDPRISTDFDKCMTTVTGNWKLPAAPRKVTFDTKMSLTPE